MLAVIVLALMVGLPSFLVLFFLISLRKYRTAGVLFLSHIILLVCNWIYLRHITAKAVQEGLGISAYAHEATLFQFGLGLAAACTLGAVLGSCLGIARRIALAKFRE